MFANPDNLSLFSDIQIHLHQQPTQSTSIITLSVPYCRDSQSIIINEALQKCHEKELIPLNVNIFYADYANRIKNYIGVFPFSSQVKVKTETLIASSLHLYFTPVFGTESGISQKLQCDPCSRRQRKNKEKTIKQIMEIVNVWRQLYDTPGKKGKRLYTLEEAAKKVGKSKKTLDDYYSQIRVGVSHKFDFDRFGYEKIGVLRKFVKLVKEGHEGEGVDEYMIDTDTDKYWNEFE